MNLTKQLKTVALAAALAAGGTVASAQDKEPIRFGLCFDLSKSYTFISPQVAQAAQDFLPLGSGLGSFDPVYRSYEPVETLRAAYFNQAHNDYLQLWLTTGWLGIALVIATFVWWGRRSWSAWRAVSHRDRDLQRAASVALLLIAAHSAGDYPLRTEAMAVVFALCCAILDGAAQELRPGRSRRRGPSNPVQEPARRHA